MSETETLPISDSEMDLDEEAQESGAEEEKEDKADKRSDTREYLIFQEGNSGNWAEFGKSIGSNADQAIKAMDPKEGVRYAAVPSRNWSVAKAKIKIETTTTLEFE